jgi:hypothetical protein
LYQQTLAGVSTPAHPLTAIGGSFAGIGDVDDDGCDDFVMGCGEPTGRGVQIVVSGATGTYLRYCYGELPGDGIGYRSLDCGDLDGDGYRDFGGHNQGFAFGASRGVVRVFSSRTGQPIHQWAAQPAWKFASSAASRGVDLDGDGIGDVVVGQPVSAPFAYVGTVYGIVHTFSGRDASQVHLIMGQPGLAGTSGSIGHGVTTLKPPVGEHIGFVVVRNPTASLLLPCAEGAIVAYRGLPRTAVTLGPACPGNLPSAPNIGMKSLGPFGVRLHVSNAPANSLAVLLLGLSTSQFQGVPLPASLNHLGLPGCELRTSIELMYTGVTGTTGIASGHAALDLPFPVPLVGSGTMSLSAQWLVVGDASTFPGGMSQALEWRQ